MKEFTIHACEQSLRFSGVSKWSDLSEKLKMQLSFNVGVMALGLDLTKEDGYQFLNDVCSGDTPMSEFHKHIKSLIKSRGIKVKEENISRPF